MSENMSRKEAAKALKEMSESIHECHTRYLDAVKIAYKALMEQEQRKPTDADLMDAFLETTKDKREFSYKGTAYFIDERGNLVEKISCGCYYPENYLLFEIIKNQDKIVWEPAKKKLTDEQVYYLKALNDLCFFFLATDSDGSIGAYEISPDKNSRFGRWEHGGEAFTLKPEAENQFKDLVSWDDIQPFDVRKALEDA